MMMSMQERKKNRVDKESCLILPGVGTRVGEPHCPSVAGPVGKAGPILSRYVSFWSLAATINSFRCSLEVEAESRVYF